MMNACRGGRLFYCDFVLNSISRRFRRAEITPINITKRYRHCDIMLLPTTPTPSSRRGYGRGAFRAGSLLRAALAVTD